MLQASDEPKKLALVVEDDQDQRELLTLLLEETDFQVVAVRTADAGVLSDADLLAIRVVDEVLDATSVSDATLAEARALLGDGDELIELVAIPGFYRAIGTLLLTFAVPLENHLEPWAPDGRAPD